MRVDQQQVFEHEHQVPDGLRQVGVLLFDVVEDLAAGGRIQAVEHLRHGAHAAVGFAAELAQRLQLLPDDAGDLEDDLGRDLVQARHAQRDVGAHVGGQRSQQRRGLRIVQVREHQRDGLRMFVVDELGQLLRIGLLNRVEGGGVGAQRFGEPVEQALGMVRVEGAQQQFAGIVDTAARHVIAGRGDLVKFFEDGLGLLGGDGRDPAPLRG